MATRKPARKKAKAKTAAKPKAEKNKGGRPTKYSKERLDAICARLRKGEPLVQICADPAIGVDDDTVRDWEKRQDVGAEVSRALARAREAGEEWLAAECLTIADTPMPGRTEKQELLGVLEREGEGGATEKVVLPTAELVTTEVRVEDMLGHRKLQIETRLKLLAVWNPRKWGNKVDHNHTGHLTLEQLVAGSHDGGK